MTAFNSEINTLEDGEDSSDFPVNSGVRHTLRAVNIRETRTQKQHGRLDLGD